jgi:hypothetical protein
VGNLATGCPPTSNSQRIGLPPINQAGSRVKISTGERRAQGTSGEDGRICRSIDYVQSNAFRMGVVQNFDSVPVEDGYNGAGEVGSCKGSTQEKKDTGTTDAKTGCGPTSQFFVPRYPSRWASMTNCAVVERTASSRL